VQLITISPKAAASLKVAVLAHSPKGAAYFCAVSLLALRVPIVTSFPIWTSLVPSALPTNPVPKTPIFIAVTFFG